MVILYQTSGADIVSMRLYLDIAAVASYILLCYDCMVIVLVTSVSSGVHTRVKSGAGALLCTTEYIRRNNVTE